MLKKIIIIPCLLIFCCSCAPSAQEFSVSQLENAIRTSPEYNQQDDFYFPILKENLHFLNLLQCMVFEPKASIETLAEKYLEDTDLFPAKSLSFQAVKNKKTALDSAQSFAQQYQNYTQTAFLEKLLYQKPILQSKLLNQQESKIKELIQSYLQIKYNITSNNPSTDNKTKKVRKHFRKLDSDEFVINDLRITVTTLTTFPCAKVTYNLKARKGEQVIQVPVEEYYLIEPTKKQSQWQYQIGYAFHFAEDFNQAYFEKFMAFNWSRTNNQAGQFSVTPTGAEFSAITAKEWLMCIENYLIIQDKYSYFVNQDWNLSQQICTQDKDYLNKIVFIGDSIFSGFAFYGLDMTPQVLTKVGVGSRNIFDLSLQSSGTVYTIPEYIHARKPTYVYIMLGLNDINMIDTAAYKNNFRTIVDTVKKADEKIKIVLVSMTPIRRLSYSSPQHIQKYNQVLQSLAQQIENVYYLDVFDFLAVDDILANKYSSADGIHFTAATYTMLLDYFYVHQVRPYDDLQSFLEGEALHSMPVHQDQATVLKVEDYAKNKGAATPFYTR